MTIHVGVESSKLERVVQLLGVDALHRSGSGARTPMLTLRVT